MPATGAEAVGNAPVEVRLEPEPEVDRDASSLRFIYPFVFAGNTIASRAGAIAAATRSIGDKSIPVWERKSFPTDDLLSQVADFVSPPEDGPPSVGLWRVSDTVLRSPSGFGGGARHPGADWTLTTRRGDVPFVMESIELALFRHGVGRAPGSFSRAQPAFLCATQPQHGCQRIAVIRTPNNPAPIVP